MNDKISKKRKHHPSDDEKKPKFWDIRISCHNKELVRPFLKEHFEKYKVGMENNEDNTNPHMQIFAKSKISTRLETFINRMHILMKNSNISWHFKPACDPDALSKYVAKTGIMWTEKSGKEHTIEELGTFKDEELFPWQKQLKEWIMSPCHPRTQCNILIVEDTKGQQGKTSLGAHLEDYHGAWFHQGCGRSHDLKNAFFEDMELLDEWPPFFFMNFTKTHTSECTKGEIWEFVEQLADGRIRNLKFKGGKCRFPRKRILIVCNSVKGLNLSKGRYEHFKLIEGKLVKQFE